MSWVPWLRRDPHSASPPVAEVVVWVVEGLEQGLKQAHLSLLDNIAYLDYRDSISFYVSYFCARLPPPPCVGRAC